MSLQPFAQPVEAIVWYAVRCRPQAEAKAIAGLMERRFDTYMPVEVRLRRTLKGRKRVEHPLIPGYIFVGVKSWQSLYFVTRVEAVQEVISVGGAAYPIPSRFVYDLMARQGTGEFDFTPRKKDLEKGAQARILSGPFKDEIGKLLSAPAEGRASILLAGLFAGNVTVDVRNLEAA